MTIKIVYDEYERSHMKPPRGRGSWAFCPLENARDNDYLAYTLFSPGSMTLKEAKQWAKKQRRWDGLTVTLMP